MRRAAGLALLVLVLFGALAGLAPTSAIPHLPSFPSHFGMSALLTLLLRILLRRTVLAALSVLALSTGLELAQLATPTRSLSAGDIWANFAGIGAALAILAAWAVLRRKAKPRARDWP